MFFFLEIVFVNLLDKLWHMPSSSSSIFSKSPKRPRLKEGLAGGLLCLRGEPGRDNFWGHGTHSQDGGANLVDLSGRPKTIGGVSCFKVRYVRAMYFQGNMVLCMGQYFYIFEDPDIPIDILNYFDILVGDKKVCCHLVDVLRSTVCTSLYRGRQHLPTVANIVRRRRISGCCWSPWTPWIPTLVPSLPCRIAMLLSGLAVRGLLLVFDGFLRHRCNPNHPSHQTI